MISLKLAAVHGLEYKDCQSAIIIGHLYSFLLFFLKF